MLYPFPVLSRLRVPVICCRWSAATTQALIWNAHTSQIMGKRDMSRVCSTPCTPGCWAALEGALPPEHAPELDELRRSSRGRRGSGRGLVLSALSRPVAWSVVRPEPNLNLQEALVPPLLFSRLCHTRNPRLPLTRGPPERHSSSLGVHSSLPCCALSPLFLCLKKNNCCGAEPRKRSDTRVFFGSCFFILLHMHATNAIALLPRSLEARQSLSYLGALRRGEGSRGG